MNRYTTAPSESGTATYLLEDGDVIALYIGPDHGANAELAAELWNAALESAWVPATGADAGWPP